MSRGGVIALMLGFALGLALGTGIARRATPGDRAPLAAPAPATTKKGTDAVAAPPAADAAPSAASAPTSTTPPAVPAVTAAVSAPGASPRPAPATSSLRQALSALPPPERPSGAASIRGRARGRDGAPFAGVEVTAEAPEPRGDASERPRRAAPRGEPPLEARLAEMVREGRRILSRTYRATSGPDGAFAIEGLPEGEFRVHASIEGRFAFIVPAAAAATPGEAPPPASAPRTPRDGDFDPDHEGDDEDEPPERAAPPGRTVGAVSARPDGRADVLVWDADLPDDPPEHPAEEPAGEIRGRILLPPDGTAFPGRGVEATVRRTALVDGGALEGRAPVVRTRKVRPPDYLYRFDALPAGRYEVSVDPGEPPTGSEPVAIAPAQVTLERGVVTADLHVPSYPRGSGFAVRVVGPDGRLRPSAQVSVRTVVRTPAGVSVEDAPTMRRSFRVLADGTSWLRIEGESLALWRLGAEPRVAIALRAQEERWISPTVVVGPEHPAGAQVTLALGPAAMLEARIAPPAAGAAPAGLALRVEPLEPSGTRLPNDRVEVRPGVARVERGPCAPGRYAVILSGRGAYVSGSELGAGAFESGAEVDLLRLEVALVPGRNVVPVPVPAVHALEVATRRRLADDILLLRRGPDGRVRRAARAPAPEPGGDPARIPGLPSGRFILRYQPEGEDGLPLAPVEREVVVPEATRVLLP